MRTSKADCIDALQKAADHLGESPTKQQYEDLGFTPAHVTIIRVMGSWNGAKEAAELETYYAGQYGGSDIEPKPEWVELPEELDWDSLSGNQRWYYKNQEKEIEKKDRRRARLRYWFHTYKLENCECTQCGEAQPAALDFHHVGEKGMAVSQMIVYGYSEDSILEEIDRCEVLCANCHREEHYTVPDKPPSQHS